LTDLNQWAEEGRAYWRSWERWIKGQSLTRFCGFFYSRVFFSLFRVTRAFSFLEPSFPSHLSLSHTLALFLMKCVIKASHETRKERIASVVFSSSCLVHVLHAYVRNGVYGLVCATRLNDRK
jgi:hypothetical protein